MADPIKPSDSSGSTSPLSPQIKVPPNLPTKETAPTAPGAGRPMTPSPRPDIKTTTPQSPAQQPGQPVFKSSIRTMEEDIAAIKKGQTPAGIQLEKQSEKDIKPPAETPGPKVTMPPKPSVQVEMGGLEKSKPLTVPRPAPAAPKIQTTPGISMGEAEKAAGIQVPPGGNILNKLKAGKNLLLIVAGLVVASGLAWFFLLRAPSVPEIVFTPTPVRTQSPTPTPALLESYFSMVSSASLALGADFTQRFEKTIDKEKLRLSAEPALYAIFNPTTNKRYGFGEFLDGLLIQAPQDLKNSAIDSEFYVTAFSKLNGGYGYGLVVKVQDDSAVRLSMNSWESAITQDLKNFLLLNAKNAASIEFLNNTRQGTAIRYKNFPDPELTVDYAVVQAINGQSYLVITNSREHIYSIIDKIR